MIKDVVSHLDYSIFAEIPLALFMLVFIAITVRVMLTGSNSVNRCASIPLDEGQKEKSE